MLACMHVCVCAHTHMPECTTGYEMDETKSLKYQAEQGVTVEPIIQVICFVVGCGRLVAELCLTLCNPVHCSPPGSSVHGIFQASTLEWVAISSSRGSSRPRDQTRVSCTAGGFLPLSHRGGFALFSRLLL